MRPLALALALAVVACGSDDIDALHFDMPGGGHGSGPAAPDGEVPAEDAGAGAGGAGGFGGSPEDGGFLEDAEDAAPDVEPEPVEDAGPDVVEEDAGDELPEAGPIGPPYENENVRCRVQDGNATKDYTCAGMWGPRWSMVYNGIDGKQYDCDGSPSDSETYRAPCQDYGNCRVYRTNDIVYGTCVK